MIVSLSPALSRDVPIHDSSAGEARAICIAPETTIQKAIPLLSTRFTGRNDILRSFSNFLIPQSVHVFCCVEEKTDLHVT